MEDEDEEVIGGEIKEIQGPRRTPRACKQCRQSKVKCTGEQPCGRCTRRNDTCTFASDEPRVSVPKQYFLDLQRRVGGAGEGSTSTPTRRLTTAGSTPSGLLTRSGDHGHARTGSDLSQTSQLSPTGPRSNPILPQGAGELGPGPASRGSAGAAAQVQEPTDVLTPSNPLISQTFSYIKDTSGRYRFLGPTSTWSFCLRAIALAEQYAPQAASSPVSLDGAAFQFRFAHKSNVDQSDLTSLPPLDYTLYMLSTVKFHLGDLFQIIDEDRFVNHLHSFHQNALVTAQQHRLWFVEYLLVLAFGKAFLSHSGPSISGPSGSEYGTRALALIPDLLHLHEEGVNAIEVLALAAIYCQSVDIRTVAFQLIGQALRLCFIEGLHREFPTDLFGREKSTRYNTLWWVVYILDREISALMGAPSSISDDEISALLPSEKEPSLSATAFTLQVHLSRIVARTCTTVYGVGEKPGDTFVRNTTAVLHSLAEVSRELDEVVSHQSNTALGGLPQMFTHTMLSCHHCIVLATRPLVMWLLMLYLPSINAFPQQLAAPTAALLQKSAESATTILTMLNTLAKHDLLDCFLPFHLEYAFASAVLLSLLETVVPAYVAERRWLHISYGLLDTMIRKGNTVAQLRKNELQHLEQLLRSFRIPSGNVRQLELANNEMNSQPQAGLEYANEAPTPSFMANDLNFNSMYMPWDAVFGSENVAANHEQLLELAEQFDVENLNTAFFFDA